MRLRQNVRDETRPIADMPLRYKVSSVMTFLQISHATGSRLVASGELTLVILSTSASRITSESVLALLGKYEVSATVHYSLSKRTMVYVAGVHQRASHGSNARINGVMGPDSGSSNMLQSIARLGLSTGF